ncbi:hypothetical protein PR048_029760 [Dryococelus australis]|uniref:Uncharacterized protein n=1 Tax=Dryococelus australis TaxID=614101 RepID=A0ABQ9GAZ3_9NEOP|nr:hypothetical protein PR048_029760 [Dryococelus australis]
MRSEITLQTKSVPTLTVIGGLTGVTCKLACNLPDLTPVNSFLLGHMKILVYLTPVDTEMELVARIHAVAAIIQDTLHIFQRPWDSLLRLRYRFCNDVNGVHIENLL